MSHFLGTPSHSRIWNLAESQRRNKLDKAKILRKRLLSGPTVDVYVGPDQKHWSLHKNLLCHHSSYFETEFQGHEVPKKQDAHMHNRLELPDDDPRGFELLVKWLYQGQLDDASHMSDEARYDYAVACYKLYQLCDKFDMILLKNLAMDSYRSNLHAAQLVPDADEINEIYRACPSGSPFRKLMTKIAARQIMDPGTEKDAEGYRCCFEGNPDFAVEMVNAIRNMSGGMLFDDPTEDETCEEWHDHRDGSECHLKRKGNLQVNGDTGMPRPMMVVSVRCNNEYSWCKGAHRTPNSAAKRLQHPRLPELSTERSTPRKLNVGSQQSPARPRTTPARQTPKSTRFADAAPTTPIQDKAGDDAAEKPTQKPTPPQKLHRKAAPTVNGENAESVEGEPRKLPTRASQHPATQANGVPQGHQGNPGDPKSTAGRAVKPTSKRVDEMSDNASSLGSGPRKTSHVNGIVSQLDGVHGSLSDWGSRSQAGPDEGVPKKPAPKLKRKTPG